MWIAKRIASSVLLIWLILSLVFLALRLVPGDPAVLLLSRGGAAPDPESIAALREQLGLNQPLLIQYFDNLGKVLTGQLGVSLQDGASVAAEIGRRLPRTLELIALAALFAVLVGIPLGVTAAVRPGGFWDRLGSAFSALSVSVPAFVVGTLFVLVFASQLRWVPAGGYVPFEENPARHLALVAMPAATLAFTMLALVFRMTRGTCREVLKREYVRTALSKGLSARQILIHHVLRNALSPVITALALHLGSLLGGAVLVEYVFNYPGLSGLLIEAVNARDYSMVQGVVLIIAVLFVTLNLGVDLLYGVLDPRARVQ